MTDREWGMLLWKLDGAGLENGLVHELALYAYDFEHVEVMGPEEIEIWRDERGDLYTRAGAMNVIKAMKYIGRHRPPPPEWEDAVFQGGGADTPEP
jgi:hypothetical protein